MLYHVAITVKVPHGADAEQIKQLSAREVERAEQLHRAGKWLHVWRVVGKWANISIFDVESPSELHMLLGSLPLYPFMEIEVTSLCEMHPPAQGR